VLLLLLAVTSISTGVSVNGRRAPRRRGKAVTIHDVARRAGVSSMTVSRVTNAEDSVRDSTREQVLRAIRELNYSPNPAARYTIDHLFAHILVKRDSDAPPRGK
jgi:transcriptional regulator with XRE-family HTH domain